MCIWVDDDGPGIDAKDRERIFDPFVRVDGDASSGSGLGLALVKRIVTKEGGQVRIDSSPEGGARFEITLADREHDNDQAIERNTEADTPNNEADH